MQRILAEPPEGVLAGENVGRESEPEEYERNAVDRLVAALKTREAYHGRPDDDLREIAIERLEDNQ